MRRWWKGGALVAAWLIGGLAVSWANDGGRYPVAVGPARMPEPIPSGHSGGYPPLIPGPISPYAAPPGPPPDLSLPETHTSAFQCEHCVPEEHWFVHLGSVILKRQEFGSQALAVLDPDNRDTGLIAPGPQPLAASFGELTPPMSAGVRGRVGYFWQSQGVEVDAFYIFANSANRDNLIPGRLNTFFRNAPVGFEGDNGLFIQADRARINLQSDLVSVEANYRYWHPGIDDCEIFMGVRYIQPHEKLRVFIDDDGATFQDVNGLPDPLRQATYGVQVRNHIVAAHIGCEWVHPLFYFLWGGLWGKAGIGPNFINRNWTLDREDGLNGFNVRDADTVVSGVFEAGAFLDFHILERLRFRAGYNILFLANVADSHEQVNFDLAFPANVQDSHGTMFFHGPMLEVQFLF
jgi:hypothetical protein